MTRLTQEREFYIRKMDFGCSHCGGTVGEVNELLAEIDVLRSENEELRKYKIAALKDCMNWKHNFEEASASRDKAVAELAHKNNDLKLAQGELGRVGSVTRGKPMSYYEDDKDFI